MLHVIRANESIDDIAKIYDIDAQEILKANKNTCIAQNSSVWVPCPNLCYFSERDEAVSYISRVCGVESGELTAFNKNIGETVHKNMRVALPRIENNFFEVFAVCEVNEDNEYATPIPQMSRHIKGAFIDGYKVVSNKLNQPYDYQAINDCLDAKIGAYFVINEIFRFSDEALTNQLLHDLSFKDYSAALIMLSGKDDMPVFEKLSGILNRFGINVSACGDESVLGLIQDISNLKYVFYKPRRNTFDFDSFAETFEMLSKSIPRDQLGYYLHIYSADIDKTNMRINYPDISFISLKGKEYDVTHIDFDEESQLCILRYTENANEHNAIFEDLRSLYSKLSYLKDNDINKLIIPKTDDYAATLASLSEYV